LAETSPCRATIVTTEGRGLLGGEREGENNFGLQDLISPSPKRFRKFLDVQDVEYGKLEAVKTDVVKVEAKVDFATKIEDFRNKINRDPGSDGARRWWADPECLTPVQEGLMSLM